VDDVVLFADDAKTLLEWRDAIVHRTMHRLRLRLHARNAHPMPVAQGVPWLGLVVFRDRDRLKSRKVVSTTRYLRQTWRDWMADGIPFQTVDARFKGWLAHARHVQGGAVVAEVLQRACRT
jgi:RNA-directed DNA polymerase